MIAAELDVAEVDQQVQQEGLGTAAVGLVTPVEEDAAAAVVEDAMGFRGTR